MPRFRPALDRRRHLADGRRHCSGYALHGGAAPYTLRANWRKVGRRAMERPACWCFVSGGDLFDSGTTARLAAAGTGAHAAKPSIPYDTRTCRCSMPLLSGIWSNPREKPPIHGPGDVGFTKESVDRLDTVVRIAPAEVRRAHAVGPEREWAADVAWRGPRLPAGGGWWPPVGGLLARRLARGRAGAGRAGAGGRGRPLERWPASRWSSCCSLAGPVAPCRGPTTSDGHRPPATTCCSRR